MSKEIGRLSRLGFSSLPECLLSAPKEYRDYQEALQILPIPDTGIRVYMVLTLTDMELYNRKGVRTRNWRAGYKLVMRGVDGRGDGINITVFGAVSQWAEHTPGDELHLYGEVTTWEGRRQITNPDFVQPHQRGLVVPLYRGKVGQVSADTLAQGVAAALSKINEAACMLLEQVGLRESDFRRRTAMEPDELLQMLHAPLSVREGDHAVGIAKSLTLDAVLGRASRNQSVQPVTGSAIPVDRQMVRQLVLKLPFGLTEDQVRVVEEIVSDLRSPFPMRRLLSGDVGTGKSLAFMLPAVAAHLAGARVAILVPNQLLVEQIAGELRTLFPGTPVCELVAGATLTDGIIVGTTAVVHAARKKQLVFDFVIADEQHKFSVDQKAALRSPHTNVLESTATAIPRTLALVGFGGMALSVLRRCPVMKKIKTRIVSRSEGGKLFDFVHQQIQLGGQVAVIYPLAEDMGAGERASVEAAFERFKLRYGDRCGMLHGKLADEEKNSVIGKMKAGELDLLVSSTVIEVGVTLPALRAVVVVHAERFGVSQLHQLRGRVARKGGVGYFFLYLPVEVEEDAMARMQLLVQCGDGFVLAERDADLRGFGDVDAGSDSQSGSTRLLFWGISLTRQEIEEGAKSLGLLEAA